MKKIRVFGLPSHQTKERTSGVDFARVIQPMKHLNGYKDSEVEFEITVFDINKETDWLYVAKNFDVIFFNYINSPWGFAAMGAMARKHRVKLVLDLDDSLWDIRQDNPAHSAYQKGSRAIKDFSAICNEVDYMTCTTNYLKNVILHNTYQQANKIKVFPNYVDLDLYTHRSPFKDTLTIQLMHYGSTTHFEDLSNQEFFKGVGKIMSEYPNVNIRFVGAFLPMFRQRWGSRYENVFGHEDIYKWISDKFPTYMNEADILIVPLEVNTYTRCKSSIKWVEASSAKKVGVWQKIRQYEEVIRDGENGFLADRAEDWYKSIKFLIDNPKERKRMNEQAFIDVKNNFTIQGHVKDYAEFFKSIVDKS